MQGVDEGTPTKTTARVSDILAMSLRDRGTEKTLSRKKSKHGLGEKLRKKHL